MYRLQAELTSNRSNIRNFHHQQKHTTRTVWKTRFVFQLNDWNRMMSLRRRRKKKNLRIKPNFLREPLVQVYYATILILNHVMTPILVTWIRIIRCMLLFFKNLNSQIVPFQNLTPVLLAGSDLAGALVKATRCARLVILFKPAGSGKLTNVNQYPDVSRV